MNKILLLIISVCLFQNVKAQQDVLNLGLDNNGIPLGSNIVSVAAPYSRHSALMPFTYDTIRNIAELNTSLADAFPWISPDALRLYYTSGTNNNALMFTQRANTTSYFAPPSIVPLSVTNPTSYWLSNNELDVYICNDSLLYAHRNTTGSPFNAPTMITLFQPFSGNMYYRDASLNHAQDKLFISAYSSGIYLGILEFSRTSPTSFSYVRTLPSAPGYNLRSGQLSKDELTYFCDGTLGMSTARLCQLTRISALDSFQVNTFAEIQGINDIAAWNIQPTMSDNLLWVAFVRTNSYTWNGDDLFIAEKGKITSVFDPANTQVEISAYPNPFVNEFKINNTKENAEATLYDAIGNAILHQKTWAGESIMNTTKIATGFYILQYVEGNRIVNIKLTKM